MKTACPVGLGPGSSCTGPAASGRPVSACGHWEAQLPRVHSVPSTVLELQEVVPITARSSTGPAAQAHGRRVESACGMQPACPARVPVHTVPLLHLTQRPDRSRPSPSSGSISRSGCGLPEPPALEGVFAPLCLAAQQVHRHPRFPSGFRNSQDIAGKGGCFACSGPEDQAAFGHLLWILERMNGDAQSHQ